MIHLYVLRLGIALCVLMILVATLSAYLRAT